MIKETVKNLIQNDTDYRSIHLRLQNLQIEPGLIPSVKNIREAKYRLRKRENRSANYVDKRKKRLVTKTVLVLIENLTKRSNGYITAKEIAFKIKKILKKQIAPSTISFYRSSMGFKYRRSKTKTRNFTNEEKAMRLSFAQRFINSDLRNLIFVDEAAFQTGRFGLYHMRKSSSRPSAVWTKSRCVDRLNIWGGISWNGPTQFVPFTTTLNSKGYSLILKNFLKPFVLNHQDESILIQDNYSKHSSNLCQETLTECNITWIKIPPYSPDINIIEHIWGDMRRFINKKYCTTVREIRSRVSKYVRNKLTIQRCKNHIEKLRDVLRMAKKSDDVECIVLKIGDKELNGENDPKIMDKYGSFIYFPYDSIDEEDLAELAKGSVITVSVKLVGVRKKVPLICHVEEIDKTMATPGIIIDSIRVGESSNVSSITTEDLIEKPKRGRKKKNLKTQPPSTLSETVVARSSNENVEKSDSTLSLNELLLSNVSDKIDGMSECLSEIRDNTKSMKELVIIMRPKDTQKTRRIIFDSKMTPNQEEDQIENDKQETLDKTVENQKNFEEDNEKIEPSLDEGADSKPSSSKKG
ncbi:unnamed protein product [Brachionus calyciflorus]|uniref:Tc1-like transposase DDE domain-containing protein n=1 Tax=Brachionus calyciflorus TaxID=104777 RepID=A0A813WV10_9BILA|nr:unnamed protein product [Brachionus calyciflorus]